MLHNSDHVEGQAIVAEKNAHLEDDDDKKKKALAAAHKRQLHNRHRGIAGFQPYRTAVWMKEGIKSRILPKKSSGKRERKAQLSHCSNKYLLKVFVAAVRSEA